MSKQLVKLRQRAAANQNNRCYYCNAAMCIDVAIIGDFAKSHNISVNQARQFICTAEHLIAKQDGGKDIKENIVAACRYCNHTRHKRKTCSNAELFKSYVCKQIRKQKWNFGMHTIQQ